MVDLRVKISRSQAGRLGAIERNRLYGNPGTPAGRKKGGLTTTRLFRENPTLAKRKGFRILKDISYPVKSAALAEFIGIVLGDGSISEYQIRISSNSKTDRAHMEYIKTLIHKLFHLDSHVALRPKNTIDITVSSRKLVDFLLRLGLKKGDKIRQQADIPAWISQNREFSRGCLRGLIDTDGGFYFHTHTTKGIRYRHIGLCFTNHSLHLLDAVYRMLRKNDINAKTDERHHVAVYNRRDLTKYMTIVGSHNPKHIEKFRLYKNSKV